MESQAVYVICDAHTGEFVQGYQSAQQAEEEKNYWNHGTPSAPYYVQSVSPAAAFRANIRIVKH